MMDNCLGKKSTYIFERRYVNSPNVRYDNSALKYWQKMIGQEALSCLPQAYGKETTEFLFSN